MSELFHKMKIPLIAASVVLIFVNLVVFLIPFSHGASFWISYGFLMLAVIAQFGVSILVYGQLFLPTKGIAFYPLVRVGFYYLIVQFIVSVLFFLLDSFVRDMFWIPLVLCIIIVFVFIGIFVATFSGIKIAENVETKTKQEIAFIKKLIVQAQIVENEAEDPELKKALHKFYETVRFSDPVSTSELADVETEIKDRFDLLKAAVSLNDIAKANEILQILDKLMYERNLKCKEYKG